MKETSSLSLGELLIIETVSSTTVHYCIMLLPFIPTSVTVQGLTVTYFGKFVL